MKFLKRKTLQERVSAELLHRIELDLGTPLILPWRARRRTKYAVVHVERQFEVGVSGSEVVYITMVRAD